MNMGIRMIKNGLWSVAALVLAVVAVACQTTGKRVGEAVQDARISTAVQARLTNSGVRDFGRVDVDTEHGVVSLSGVVESADRKARAAELAREIDGVKRVANHLQIGNPLQIGSAEP
jgi:hyperosmotically inducible protein